MKLNKTTYLNKKQIENIIENLKKFDYIEKIIDDENDVEIEIEIENIIDELIDENENYLINLFNDEILLNQLILFSNNFNIL